MGQKDHCSVTVFDWNGNCLNSCRPARARTLIEQKKAIVISKEPFSIQLRLSPPVVPGALGSHPEKPEKRGGENVTKEFNKKLTLLGALFIVAAVAVLLDGGQALAATAPVAGDIGYSLYDLGVNKLIGGPPGFIMGSGLVGYGLYSLGISGDTGTALKASLAGGGILGIAGLVNSIGAFMGAVV